MTVVVVVAEVVLVVEAGELLCWPQPAGINIRQTSKPPKILFMYAFFPPKERNGGGEIRTLAPGYPDLTV